MNKNTTILLLSCLVLLLISVFTVSGQTPKTNLIIKTATVFDQQTETEIKDKRITLNQTKQPLGRVLYRLVFDYNIQIGFEPSLNDENHNDYWFEPYLHLKSNNLNDGYYWIVSGQTRLD